MKIPGKKRLAVSPVIATLLLIAIAVAAAIIVYAFVTGLIGGLSTGAGSSLVTITGGLSVSTGTGPGVMTLSIKNGASNPISAIKLVSLENGGADFYCPTAGFATDCATHTDAVLAWATLPLAVGSTASTSLAYAPSNVVAGFTSGNVYTALFLITFANGSTQSYTYDMTAHL